MKLRFALVLMVLAGACTPTAQQAPVASSPAETPEEIAARAITADVFRSRYLASWVVATTCEGITTYSPQGAASIASDRYGLRGAVLLRDVLYGRTDALRAEGAAELRSRGIDPGESGSVCRFGRRVAGTDDAIGLFLRAR